MFSLKRKGEINMKLSENIRSSYSTITGNKLRTFLTMLGIIIGVSSVITLTSIGEGMKAKITSQVESLGANLIYVIPGNIGGASKKESTSKLGITREMFSQKQSVFTYNDVLKIKSIPHVEGATGVQGNIDKLDKLKLLVSTTGVDEAAIKTSTLDLKYGRFITRKDRTANAKVAVIGDEVNKELFNGLNSIGKKISLNGIQYSVVGILQYKKPENMGPLNDDVNVKIYLPITEILERTGEKTINQIVIRVDSSKNVETVSKSIRNIIEKNNDSNEFSVLKQKDMIDTVDEMLGILNAGLGGIAAISLLVGGIGIMNIMLVSVTERTREIGLRKAVGARKKDILSQFLVESVVLSLCGGILGILLGYWGSLMIPAIFPDIPTAISPRAVLISISFAIATGIFFGVYPATRASKLDPIEALRSE